MALTPKQQRFVDEYPIDLNATQAAIRAGYSPKTAYSQGQRLLKNVEVSRAIQAKQKAISAAAQIDAEYVLRGLKGEAEFVGEGSSHSARVSAYGLLGKHLGMFKDKIEHSGGTTQTHIYLPQKDAPGASDGKPASA